MRGGERVNDLDWEHVIEEVEDVCGSQLSAVKSHLGLITMLHALKALAWPEHPAVEHWQQEVAAFLANAQHGASSLACSSTSTRPTSTLAL